VEDVVGPLGGHAAHLRTRRSGWELSDALRHLEREPGLAGADDEPVFVLAAGWRSGSTLVQRIVMSSSEVFVWGEPWGRCDLLGALSRSLRPIGPDWPPPAFFTSALGPDAVLHLRWVAALYPPHAALVESHRALFRELYDKPARALGFSRWGTKEVRYGIDEARYLRLLFPRAKFVLVCRDPYACWASYRASRFASYRRWPSDPVLTAHRFGRLWRELAEGFVARHGEVDGLLVRYEDLTHDAGELDRIAAYLGFDVRREALEARIGETRATPLSEVERRVLRHAAGPLARDLGYS
jgi:hypothetical protein